MTADAMRMRDGGQWEDELESFVSARAYFGCTESMLWDGRGGVLDEVGLQRPRNWVIGWQTWFGLGGFHWRWSVTPRP